jgi:phage-related protein
VISEIAGALQTVFGMAAQAAADVLTAIEFAIEAIVEVLVTLFGVAEDALEGILSAAGWAADAISDALEALGDFLCGIFGC